MPGPGPASTTVGVGGAAAVAHASAFAAFGFLKMYQWVIQLSLTLHVENNLKFTLLLADVLKTISMTGIT